MSIVKGMRAERVEVNGEEYFAILGTGEMHYGQDGGECAFVYDDVAEDERHESYQEFCDRHQPVEDRDVAIALAARYEWRVTVGGAGRAVLSDEEYALVRAAAKALA